MKKKNTRLGVTAVDVMPIHAFVNNRHLLERVLRNYWGYNSIGFFAPAPCYLETTYVNEFNTIVKALHSAGIEIILDVVYNHTAECNQFAPTLSFRGIDNFFFSSSRRHTRLTCDWSSDVCSSDLSCSRTGARTTALRRRHRPSSRGRSGTSSPCSGARARGRAAAP